MANRVRTRGCRTLQRCTQHRPTRLPWSQAGGDTGWTSRGSSSSFIILLLTPCSSPPAACRPVTQDPCPRNVLRENKGFTRLHQSPGIEQDQQPGMLKESRVGSRRALPKGRTKSPCQRSTIRGFTAKVRTQESIKAEEEILSVMGAALGEDRGEGAALQGQSQQPWLSAPTPEDLSKHRELSPACREHRSAQPRPSVCPSRLPGAGHL